MQEEEEERKIQSEVLRLNSLVCRGEEEEEGLHRSFCKVVAMPAHSPLGMTKKSIIEEFSPKKIIPEEYQSSIQIQYANMSATSTNGGKYVQGSRTQFKSDAELIEVQEEADARRTNINPASYATTLAKMVAKDGAGFILHGKCGSIDYEFQSPHFQECIRNRRNMKMIMHFRTPFNHRVAGHMGVDTSNKMIQEMTGPVITEELEEKTEFLQIEWMESLVSKMLSIEILLQKEQFSYIAGNIMFENSKLLNEKQVYGYSFSVQVVHMKYTYFNHLYITDAIRSRLSSMRGGAN
jgi:hypothetical protein